VSATSLARPTRSSDDRRLAGVAGRGPARDHAEPAAAAVGVRRARQLSYTGELIDAAEALRLGLANEVLPHDDLLPRAREVAAAVAAVDPGFLADLRAAYQRRGNLGTDDALDAERAESSRREIAADGVAARRDEVITRGHRRIQREEH
jgi:enoyl-CoA hydratase